MCGTRLDTVVCEWEVASLLGDSNDLSCGAVPMYEVIIIIITTIIVITKCLAFRKPSVYQTVSDSLVRADTL